MTTSFSVTRNSIIKAALRATGQVGLTQIPPPEMMENSSEALNIMIKQWMAKGVPLWKIQEIVLPLVPGVNKYPLGPTAAYVHCVPVIYGGSGHFSTSAITFSAPDVFSGFTGETATGELVLVDIPGGDSGVVESVRITDGGGGYVPPYPEVLVFRSNAEFGTPVLVGKTVQRPLRILDLGNFIRNTSYPDSPPDTPVSLLGRSDYMTYGSKFSGGIVNSIFYDPQLVNGWLYVYTNVAGSGCQYSDRELHLFAQYPFEDMDEATTAPDFPQEWFAPLKWGLARELVVEYGVDEVTERRIEAHYKETIGEGLTNSVDEASAYFTYDNRGR